MTPAMRARGLRHRFVRVVALVVGLALVPVVAVQRPAAAADPSTFQPGSLISDALFFDGNAMTAGDVQAFLNLKEPACASGYTCLKNYVQQTTTRSAETGLCNGYTGAAAETAAQIIANVGASCGISQKAILVTLQKENSLVTSQAPSSAAYKTAMGYGCPDTSVCDSLYFGFFNQVYSAARQFKRYAQSPASYSYLAGRDNSILYNPNTACGRSTVYIDNQATAGLYDYTPYQPNAAALANLYGSGDYCSAYGNRNFWRDYTDWFGSTQVGANLVRTLTDPTVYLITFDHKYPVSDPTVLDSLSVLGSVGFVSQSFLDSRTTGVTLGRFIRDRAGVIYLFDRGYLFRVRDCTQLADWGASCSDYATMTLSDIQMAGWTRGGDLTNDVITTDGGRRFVVWGGAKHEVADDASLASSPIPVDPPTAFRTAALAGLSYGPPIVRTDLLVRDRSTGDYLLTQVGRAMAVAPGVVVADGLDRSLPVRDLDHASVLAMPRSAATIGGAVADAGGTNYLLTPQRAIALPAGQRLADPSLVPVVSDSVVAALAPTPGPALLRSLGDPTLYLASPGVRRPIPTMAIASALTAPSAVRFAYVSDALVNALTVGPAVLAPGSLVKSTDAPQVYLVDGATGLVPITDFAISNALGIAGWSAVAPADLAPYQTAGHGLTSAVSCGNERLVGTGSGVVSVPRDAFDGSGTPTTVLDSSTCTALVRQGSVPLPAIFLRSAGSPVLYLMDGGQRRQVPTMTAAYALAPNGLTIVLAPQPLIDALPVGSPVATPGTLVKGSPATVYFVNGAHELIPLPSFAVSDALAVTGYTTVPDSDLSGYTVRTDLLGSMLYDGTTYLVGSGSALVPVSAAVVTAAPLLWTSVLPGTVARFPRGAASGGPVFVRSYDDAALYLASGGQLHPVASMTRVYQLTGGRPPVIGLVAPSVLAGIPVGSAA